MNLPKPKPCPFCGVLPHVVEEAFTVPSRTVVCQSKRCRVWPFVAAKTKALALTWWNRRGR